MLATAACTSSAAVRLIHRTEDHTYAEQLRLEGRQEDAEIAAGSLQEHSGQCPGHQQEAEDRHQRGRRLCARATSSCWQATACGRTSRTMNSRRSCTSCRRAKPRSASFHWPASVARVAATTFRWRSSSSSRSPGVSAAASAGPSAECRGRLFRALAHRLALRFLLFQRPACARARRSSRFLRSAALASARLAASVCFCWYSGAFCARSAASCCSFARRSACSCCLRS